VSGGSSSVDRLAGDILRQFCRFVDAKRVYRHLPDYGQAILLTGLSVASGAPLGIAYRGGACWPGVDCALLMVPRRRLFRIAFTAAHELGHGLRLGHRAGAGGLMMSRQLAADWPDAFRWSADSALQLRSEVEAMGEHSICMRRINAIGHKIISNISDVIQWNPDRVCDLVTDGQLPVSGVPFKSMQCRMFCCRAAAPSAASLSVVASSTSACTARISAFNGMFCGGNNNGRCFDGQCIRLVSNSSTASAT
uniref:Peptidase M12B domain-containing protein n=1 Tax=Macrostomum lignano TaxID=282301 RepID=A0A1I8HI81_9PLAT